MFPKAQLDRALKLLLDALSNLNFEEIPPLSERGKFLGLKPEAKGRALNRKVLLLAGKIFQFLSLLCSVKPLLIPGLLALLFSQL